MTAPELLGYVKAVMVEFGMYDIFVSALQVIVIVSVTALVLRVINRA